MITSLVLSAALVFPCAAEDEARAIELVRLLGDSSYKVREKAADDLERLGSAALEPLRKGLKHPDAEIGERCRKLLPLALDHHLKEQIEIFLAKPDGPISDDLPGIKRWLQVAGKSKESRELYALLVREQRRVLIDIEQDRDKAGQRFQVFLQEIYNRTRNVVAANARNEIVSYSELALFLFLGGDPQCRKNNGATSSISYLQSNVFMGSTHLGGMLSGSGSSEATRGIFLSWLEQERYPTLMRRGFQLAASANLKEAAPMAIRVANDKTSLPTARSYALLGAVKLFSADNVKQLDGLMKDDTVVGRTTVNNQAATAEMRDIALGIAIMATNQKPADYGFDRLQNNPAAITTSYYYFTLTEKQREEAHKKWKEWSEKNLKP